MGKDMDLNFEIFMIVLLVLSIVVVGNFLRDGESNYLEGALLMVSLAVRCIVVLLIVGSRLSTLSLLLPLGTIRTQMSPPPMVWKAPRETESRHNPH
jgi:hypothetical protein